jgi:hypothetical protein
MWLAYGGASSGQRSDAVCSGASSHTTAPSAAERPENAVFIHFVPPPLRKAGKKDLAWIVHTCDGSGCYEATHVNFESVTGMSTFEGSPPEQKCECNIANHHLRGYGRLQWECGVVHGVAKIVKPEEDACKDASRNAAALEEFLEDRLKALAVEKADAALESIRARRIALEEEFQQTVYVSPYSQAPSLKHLVDSSPTAMRPPALARSTHPNSLCRLHDKPSSSIASHQGARRHLPRSRSFGPDTRRTSKFGR